MISIRSIVTLILVFFVSTISVDGKAVATNCGSSSDVIKLTNFQLVPDPVKVPVVAQLQLTAALSQDLVGPIKTIVTLKTKVLFIWVTVPCENGVGSCTYDDWCTLCKTCVCPLKAGTQLMTMTMNMTTAVPDGNYEATIEFKSATGQTGCVSIKSIEVQ